MPPVSLSSSQNQQIEDLRSYVQDYCQTNGIDPAIYTQALDPGNSLDPQLLNDPAFVAYWQLAYLQLMEIINPTAIQSLYTEVGEVNFDLLFTRTAESNPELNELVRRIVADSPELMAAVAASDTDVATDPLEVMNLILAHIPSSQGAASGEEGEEPVEDPLQFVDHGARKWKEEFGLSDAWDDIIEMEETNLSWQNFSLNEMAELDAQVAKITDALRGGKVSADEMEANKADLQSISQQKQFYMGMLQNFQQTLNTRMELISKMLKTQNESMQAVVNNLRRS